MNASDMAWQKQGVILQTGLGTAYPEIKPLMLEIFRKVAVLPWVPSGWLDEVRNLQAANPGDVVRVAPASKLNGAPSDLQPGFLNSSERRAVWDKLSLESATAIREYAAGQQKAGAATLLALQRNAAFWSAAYDIAVAIASAPKTVIGAAGDVATGILSETLKKWILPLAIVGVVAFIYFNKGALTSAALKKVGAG